jgi:tyrosyl-tRNA synthetase
VVMDTDLEIGGTDQIFNMLIGRELQRKMNNKEKFVLTCPMLLGTDGNPMSKSSGNCIWIEDSAKQMFGKIMSIPDKLIIPYFEFLTDVSSRLLQKYKKDIQLKRVNPKNLKTQLAFEVVKMYHSERAAKEVGKEFDKIFRERKLPSKIRSAIIKDKFLDTCSLLTKTKLAPSKSEAKRLIFQGGVKIDGKVKKDWKEKIKIKRGQIIQVGKRKFVKIG